MSVSPEDCPTPEYHETHHYCPSCSYRSEAGETPYSLVMPFTNVKSKGGTFDDDAFVAGYECGQIDKQLQDLSRYGVGTSTSMTVHSANLDQLDLIAMRHDCAMERAEGDDNWTHVTFRRVD